VLFDIETPGYRFITSVSADTSEQAEQAFWDKAQRKAPELIPMFKRIGILVIHRSDGCRGSADFRG